MLARCSLTNRQPLRHTAGSRRSVSGALHFYSNKQLELYAAKEAKRLTLRQLVRHISVQTMVVLKLRVAGLLRKVDERGASHNRMSSLERAYTHFSQA
jgi:hypothetical protein